jgi:2-polyprenyl-3-methyl-5-hydroxy-6-metoxy-1,4-benzoquinol methylase
VVTAEDGDEDHRLLLRRNKILDTVRENLKYTSLMGVTVNTLQHTWPAAKRNDAHPHG